MKTSEFEIQFTEWLDGRLPAAQAAAFEEELRRRGLDPAAERAAADATRQMLKAHSSAPELPHADFFQHQLMNRIERELAEAGAPRRRAGRSWLSLPRLAWAGACCLLLAGVMFKAMIPVGGGGGAAQEPSKYFATIVDARTFTPDVSAVTVYDPRDNLTVLWLEGLDFVPETALQ
jgi:anti-sigma factor RsiW